ncbi:hypothetical protein ABLE68_06380 [Nocardioides sp. CN2-186]|uniref:hypothetical protein n=1 Tax=Nocardioides tweenelious TaxID=3156607 RepID=UPI0032B5EB35
MDRFRSLASAAFVLAATVAALPASATAAPAEPQTRVIADCVHRKVEPRTVVPFCADGNVWAVIKRYGSWGHQVAWGSGRLHMNDCDPSCSAGTVHSYQATFRLYRVVETRSGPMFTRLGVTYVKGGEQKNVHYSLPKNPL